MGVDPTKLTACTVGLANRASTAILSPCTTLKTPSGRPASLSISASRSDALGSRSLGLRTKVLPHARAIGNIHIGTIAGKLKGVIPATTPRGWRTDQLSIPGPTCSVNSPLSSCGMPVANSTTSSPRVASPLASEKTFPCSLVRSAATSSSRCSNISRKRKSTRALLRGGCADHAGNAAAAAATAVSTSAGVAKATFACNIPLAGLYTSPNRPELPVNVWPLTQWWTSRSFWSVGREVATVDVTDMIVLLSRGFCYQPQARISSLSASSNDPGRSPKSCKRHPGALSSCLKTPAQHRSQPARLRAIVDGSHVRAERRPLRKHPRHSSAQLQERRNSRRRLTRPPAEQKTPPPSFRPRATSRGPA